MSNENSQVQLEALEGERGLPSVNDHGPSTAKRGVIVILVLVLLVVGGGAVFWKIQQKKDSGAQASQQRDMAVQSAVPSRTFSTPPALPGPAAPPAPEVVVPEPQAPVVGATAAPALPGQARTPGQAGMDVRTAPLLDKSGSDMMVRTSARNNTMESDGGAAAAARASSGGEGSGALAQLLTSSSTPMRTAGHLGNRNFILAKGSFIDCALQTRLDSTVPGMTSCVVTRDIYSDNGKVLLVERGSEVSGEYQSNMRQGQARIFVLWSRIKTPNGVVINLDSPGTDPLGGAGVPGWVDTHFWERFGGAIMLSLIDDVARYATQGSQGNNNQINFSSTGDAAQNMAAEALRNTINIPPTLYKNQGEQVGIYIARDLDFSSVYDVAASR